jgi:hypothetical protein
MSTASAFAIPYSTVRWQCPFCRRTRASRAAAERHIPRCFRNPASRGCKTCVYYEPGEDGDPGGYPYPGTREGCGEGIDISQGLKRLCETWSETA